MWIEIREAIWWKKIEEYESLNLPWYDNDILYPIFEWKNPKVTGIGKKYFLCFDLAWSDGYTDSNFAALIK